MGDYLLYTIVQYDSVKTPRTNVPAGKICLFEAELAICDEIKKSCQGDGQLKQDEREESCGRT